MLISFSVKNWMSFRDQVSFSMIASKEKQHGERVPQVKKYGAKILPIAAIYGGNASGKTNFFHALKFVKHLVVGGTQPDGFIAVEPFALDSKSAEQPSSFCLELMVDENIYEFSFSVNRKAVLEEKLVMITGTSEKDLYFRHNGKIEFDKSLSNDKFLKFAFQGTRDNNLFLTNSVWQKVEKFKPIYDWFKDSLQLVAPDSRFESFELFFDKAKPLHAIMNEMLPQLDTGIQHLDSEDIPFPNLPFPEPIKAQLNEGLKEGMTARLASTKERFIVTRKNGVLNAKKLVAYHCKEDGVEVKFEIRQESDGSLRVIDLMPAFLELESITSKKVYVIDEIDRSLHTLLTRQLIENYLATCSAQSRNQLLLTTHDVLLMDQHLFRRDEMWVAERNSDGNSTLTPFSEFKDVRYDKDIRKSYLQGRLGGIPRILAGVGCIKSNNCQKK